jgi:hypothetical protein
MTETAITGGCQCGAVRFSIERLGRASVCHCRMCQKAFGAFYGPLVTAYGLAWTRGEPTRFASSNLVRRGFCAVCGTPLTYEREDVIEIAIGALDAPTLAAPVIEVNPADKLPFVDGIPGLPVQPSEELPASADFKARVVNHQHPDHDTKAWPPAAA